MDDKQLLSLAQQIVTELKRRLNVTIVLTGVMQVDNRITATIKAA